MGGTVLTALIAPTIAQLWGMSTMFVVAAAIVVVGGAIFLATRGGTANVLAFGGFTRRSRRYPFYPFLLAGLHGALLAHFFWSTRVN